MLNPILSRLRALRRDSDGTSVIEFALLAPILAVTLMGVTDISLAYSNQLALEQAAFRALEKVTVGTVQSDYNYLRAEAAAADGPGGVTESHVTVTTRLECDHVPQPLFDGTCLPNQMISRYVGVSIAYTYRPIFFEGPLAAFGDSNGNVALAAASSVRVQ